MTFSVSINDQKRSKYKFVMSKQGLIAYDKEKPTTVRFNEQETDELLKKKIDYNKYDYFCEVAHLEISNRCNMDCTYCYVSDKNGIELSTRDWKSIIDNLAMAGIFQVSFGGGEPTLRKDLITLARYVSKRGMNLGMTTNGSNLQDFNPKLLRKYFKQINVSWHANMEVFEEALIFLHKNGIPRGINYCFSKKMAEDNNIITYAAKKYDAEILYLVYKPIIKDTQNQISPQEVYRVAKKAANDGLKVAVDGPCVNQCLMKQKFVDVDHYGNVYPCSFIRTPIGNLLRMDFREIWKRRGPQEECPYVQFTKKEK